VYEVLPAVSTSLLVQTQCDSTLPFALEDLRTGQRWTFGTSTALLDVVARMLAPTDPGARPDSAFDTTGDQHARSDR
jgi:hypothetical protein